MTKTLSLTHLLKPYQDIINQAIKDNLLPIQPETKLKEAMLYAALNGGKRFRPTLVLMVAEGLSASQNVLHAALAIEYFHTASLIADDLPCMDDDDVRREKPSLHKVYGEALAILTSYALISQGYEAYADASKVHQASKLPNVHENSKIFQYVIKNASQNTGIQGATGGQFLDLVPPDLKLKTVQNILHKKTTTLFEIAFISGWLFGGGSINQIESVKQAAYHFGQAFQIADDFGDSQKDKESGRQVNLPNLIGFEKAHQIFQNEIKAYLEKLKTLKLENPPLHQLAEYLKSRVDSILSPNFS